MNNTGKRTLILVVAAVAVLLSAFAWWWSGRPVGGVPSGQELQQIQAERAMKRERERLEEGFPGGYQRAPDDRSTK